MAWVYLFGALLGLCVGSFLNVVIYRLPNGMNLATPPSHCPGCGHHLKWYENIPLFSYAFLRGKCRICKMHISYRYPLVEAANAILWVLCIFLFWETSIPLACLFAAACSLLLCMIATDIDEQLVPQSLQIVLLCTAIAVTVLDKTTPWYDHLIGMAVFGVAFWLIGYFFRKKSGKEALGGADIELAFIAGLMLGWQKMLLAMLVSSVFGSVILLILRKKKNEEKDKTYPFIPFMGGGIYVALFLGDLLINGYKDLLMSFIR